MKTAKSPAFRPTPFLLTESDTDDVMHALRARLLLAVAAGDDAAAGAWREAERLIEEARNLSFERRSQARFSKRYLKH